MDITPSITADLTRKQFQAYKLKRRLLWVLRGDGDIDAATELIRDFLHKYQFGVSGGSYLEHLSDAVSLIPVLCPDWSLSECYCVSGWWRISLIHKDGQVYRSKYVAKNPLYPLVVSILSVRILDFGQIIEGLPGRTIQPVDI